MGKNFIERLDDFLVSFDTSEIQKQNLMLISTLEAQYLSRIIHMLDGPTVLLKHLQGNKSRELSHRERNAIYYSVLLALRPAVVAAIEAIYIIIKKKKVSVKNLDLHYIFYANLFRLRADIIKNGKIKNLTKKVIGEQLENLIVGSETILKGFNIVKETFTDADQIISNKSKVPSTTRMLECIVKDEHYIRHANLGTSFMFLSKLEHYGSVTNELFVEQLETHKLVSISIHSIIYSLLCLINEVDTGSDDPNRLLNLLDIELTSILNIYSPAAIAEELKENIIFQGFSSLSSPQ